MPALLTPAGMLSGQAVVDFRRSVHWNSRWQRGKRKPKGPPLRKRQKPWKTAAKSLLDIRCLGDGSAPNSTNEAGIEDDRGEREPEREISDLTSGSSI